MVKGSFGDPDLVDDVLNGGLLVALGIEELLGNVEDLIASEVGIL